MSMSGPCYQATLVGVSIENEAYHLGYPHARLCEARINICFHWEKTQACCTVMIVQENDTSFDLLMTL